MSWRKKKLASPFSGDWLTGTDAKLPPVVDAVLKWADVKDEAVACVGGKDKAVAHPVFSYDHWADRLDYPPMHGSMVVAAQCELDAVVEDLNLDLDAVEAGSIHEMIRAAVQRPLLGGVQVLTVEIASDGFVRVLIRGCERVALLSRVNLADIMYHVGLVNFESSFSKLVAMQVVAEGFHQGPPSTDEEELIQRVQQKVAKKWGAQ